MDRVDTEVRPAPSLHAGAAQRRLMVISNRLPVEVHRNGRVLEYRKSPGGLVSALEPLLSRRGGTWIGWGGADFAPEQHVELPPTPYTMRPVPLSGREVADYYHGFANRTLWPLLHCFPTRTRLGPHEWEVYQRVNRRFAEAAAATVSGADLAWIHDYHLLLVPQYLRAQRPQTRCAFFLHVPFPPYDIFRLLPWDRELLRGLLACDLIGFHVSGYARNFLDCVERLLGVRVDWQNRLVEDGDRTLQVGVFPLGIDYDFYAEQATAAPAARRDERIVLGVDRLDYTKGIPERILAFERLLEAHPEHRERVVFLQLAVPSRSRVAEYRQLKRQIDELIGRVNGRFTTARWSPIRYLYRSFTPERLAALYRDASVALITPLRDGMNLVAKEFVAAQVADPGVLVLSRLAGAAETMQEALLVNPYNIEGTAEAIHRALTMDEEERRSRLAALRRRERRDNVYVWGQRFLAAALTTRPELRPPSDEDIAGWLEASLSGHRLALFLDYDGTLTPLRDRPEQATLSAPVRHALAACLERGDTDVTVISGRTAEDLQRLVDIDGISYAASHGMEITGPGLAPFRHPDLPPYAARMPALATALDALAPAGAWTERKGAILTFHFRSVEPGARPALAARAREIIAKAGFQARDAHCAVEARPPIGWDKGQAVLRILRSRYGAIWPERAQAIYVGDDETDEDAFRVLAGLGHTFRVGSAQVATYATRRLSTPRAVQAVLEWLAHRPRIAAADAE